MEMASRMFQSRKKRICYSLSIALGLMSHHVKADSVVATEQKLISGLSAINELQMEQAINQFSQLGQTLPKYKLAQLITADLLAARAGQFEMIEQVRQRHHRSVEKLLDEAEVRWQFASQGAQNLAIFDDFILKTAAQKHIILVSLKESRLFLYERSAGNQMALVADYYVTMGRKGSGKQKEGDLRTPIGVYHLVDLLPGEELPDLYGVGALPLNYPNEWDKKNGKTGSGIWLHGVPSDTYIRPPRASRGCVVLNNDAMERLLAKYDIPFSTPVVIVDEQVGSFVESKQTVLADVRAWLKDNNHKVNWEEVSVYRYPNEKNLYYVTFPGEGQRSLTHQFWEKSSKGKWTLVVESNDVIEMKTILAKAKSFTPSR